MLTHSCSNGFFQFKILFLFNDFAIWFWKFELTEILCHEKYFLWSNWHKTSKYDSPSSQEHIYEDFITIEVKLLKLQGSLCMTSILVIRTERLGAHDELTRHLHWMCWYSKSKLCNDHKLFPIYFIW